MANGYKGDVARLVNSDYLYKVLKLEDDRVKSKLKDEIYTTKTITVLDTPEYYDNASAGDSGALKVVTVVGDPSTEIALTDINTQSTPVNLTSLTGDGTEYVKLIPAVTHEEEVDETKFLPRNAIDVNTVSKLSTIEEEQDDGSKKEFLAFNGSKIETELQLDNVPTKDSDKFVNSGAVYGSLFETKQRTVIDTPENYVVCQSTDTDALEVVDDSAVPTATQVKLSTVQAFVPTASIGEYYQHVDEVTHEEDYEDTIYRKKEESYSSTDVDEKIKEVNDRITEVASGGLKPLEMATYRTFFDNLVITADGYVEPQP